jgi:lysyl-tRNA synthetase class I
MIAQSTALVDRPPFLNVFSYALMRDEKGEEMHKSKGNAIWFDDAAEEFGVDVIYLTAERVKLAADHLAATEFAKIAGRYDAERMAELGVQGAEDWVGEPAEAIRDGELRVVYERLTRFFEAASAEGQAIFKAMGSTSRS